MSYSYSQISQYLTCPRRYRHRYLDGWQERETRASMCFGRTFERALAAVFRGDDGAAVLFEDWSRYRDSGMTYARHETWDGMLQQGIQLLQRFVQDGRVQILRPISDQQILITRRLPMGCDFVSVLDAVGELDGRRCVLEWKTTSARYAEEPAGIATLDPQLICYSWISGIEEVAQVVFVRKRAVEIQYRLASISEEQRRDFAALVEEILRRIESGLFLPQSGIRYPQNPCPSCPFVGLCLDDVELVNTSLVRQAGADLGVFDELCH